ncbi:hypothetical protein K7X08_007022 [Anisodus acutangulus]|uniref:Uncharacterized protein n=1 Tax=Anisodus acutangulus TaxID=402998 RepID=A0A9Q1LF07_9SOLA|nr:hypothetical protein K7X08_007022 [Anisodus acutangulus]
MVNPLHIFTIYFGGITTSIIAITWPVMALMEVVHQPLLQLFKNSFVTIVELHFTLNTNRNEFSLPTIFQASFHYSKFFTVALEFPLLNCSFAVLSWETIVQDV